MLSYLLMMTCIYKEVGKEEQSVKYDTFPVFILFQILADNQNRVTTQIEL